MKRLKGTIKGTIFVVIMAALVSLTLFACAGKPAGGGDPFGEYTGGDDGYTREDWTEKDIAALLDAGTAIDGVFNEAFYATVTPFSFTATEDGKYAYTLAVYFGQKGFYIKSEITDPAVFYNPAQPGYQNTSLTLYIAPYGSMDKNTIQVRAAINGNTDQWFGKPSSDGYPYSRGYIASAVAVKIVKTDGTFAEFTKGGSVSLDTDIKGWQCEAFVPYAAVGLSSAPASIAVSPEMNAKDAYSANRTLYAPGGTAYDNPMTWQVFTPSGYAAGMSAPIKAIDGTDGKLGGSAGWDVSDYLTGGKITQTGTGDQKAYLTEVDSDKYFIEARIKLLDRLNGDNYPKAGIIAGETSNNTYVFLADPWQNSGSFSNNAVLAVDRNTAGNDWTWPGANASNATANVGVARTSITDFTLGVARDGADFYFYIDGKFVLKKTGVRGLPAGTFSRAGFMTMNIKAEYSEFVCKTAPQEVTDVINQRGYRLVPPTQTSYEQGQPFNLAGAKLIKYNDTAGDSATEVEVTQGMVSDYASLTSAVAASKTVTVNYLNCTWTFSIAVTKAIGSLEMVPESATSVRIGTDLDRTAFSVKINYADGTDETKTFAESSATVTNFDKWTAGSQTITVAVGSKTVTHTLTVVGKIGNGQFATNSAMGTWDVSADSGASAVTKNAGGGGDNYAYFSALKAVDYVIEAKIVLGDRLNSDANPKAGLIAAAREDGKRLLFIADPAADKSRKDFLAVHNASGGWNWPGTVANVSTVNYGTGVTLKVIKKGGEFWFFVDGVFRFRRDFPEFAGEAVAGFATMNHKADYSDYSFTVDNPATLVVNEVEAAIAAAAGVAPTERTIDGDLSDWTGDMFTTNKVLVENRSANTAAAGKEVTFYAYLGADGLYLGVVAKHQFFHNSNIEWRKNSNFEFFINGGNQRWVIERGANIGYGKMLTVDSGTPGNTRYTTTTEAFIPTAQIPGGVDTEGFVRIGFAWKTSGDGAQGGGEWDDAWMYKDQNDCYWRPTDHEPNNAGQQYYVYDDGIYASAQ